MQASTESSRSSPSTDAPAGIDDIRWRRRGAVVGALLLVAETIFALMQPPRTEPLRGAAPMSLDWWRYPVERNAMQRLPISKGELTAVFARRGTSDVWFAGSGGLVVHSRDGGRTWESTNLQAQPQMPAAATQSRTAASIGPGVPSGTSLPVRLASFELRHAPSQQSPQQQVQQQVQQKPRPSAPPRFDSTAPSRRNSTAQPRPNSAAQTRPDSQATALPNASSKTPAVAPSAFYPHFTGICVTRIGIGWVVGERGAAFRTTDDGKTWTQESTGTEGAFGPIVCDVGLEVITVMSDGLVRRDLTEVRGSAGHVTSLTIGARGTLWASANYIGNPPGTIVRSSDTGRTWIPDSAAGQRSSAAIAFADSLTGFVVDSLGVAATRDGGTTWTRTDGCALGSGSPWLSSVAAASATVGLLADVRHRLWVTHDGWASCEARAQFKAASSVSLAATSEKTWYAAAGGAFRSTDGGRTWHSLINTTRFFTVLFRDSLHGVAGVENGLVASTENGGRAWTFARLDSLATLPPLHLSQRTPEELFAATDDARQFRSGDGGRSWEPYQQSDSVVPLFYPTAQTGWGARGRQTLVTRDGGVSWTRSTPSGALAALPLVLGPDGFDGPMRGISFLHAGDSVSRTWVTTKRGRLVSFDGSTWDTLAVNVTAASPVTPTLAYGLDTLGNLVRSSDGGGSWSAAPMDEPRKYPAPWYYGLVVLTIGGTLAASRVQRTKEGERERSIADILVSDRPLREGDRDVLDFGKIAAGLSRFIRNSRTEPPLTIAVTGPWGTGKSSLMNLLRRDLERRRFRTIWFNAWHHQREESLLASLLESIRLTATPPVWTPKGVRFRRRLLAKRIARYKVPALTLLPIFAFAVGYILKDPAKRLRDLGEFFTSLVGLFSQGDAGTAAARTTADSVAASSPAGSTSPNKTAIALVVSIVGTVLTYLKGLKSFGVKPAEVARSVVSAGRVRTIESQPAFRYRFAQDFSEVTEALKPERIVIFIDDLDRCKPEQVLEILEAINFLADSGDCVVVLGIDRERVTGCVAIGFKDVATVLAETRARAGVLQGTPHIGGAAPEPVKSDIEYQLEYARHYLEKLLNMEIPIPPATAEGLGEVMTNAGPSRRSDVDDTPDVDVELRERDRRRMRGRVYVGIVSAVALAAFVIGFKGTFRRAVAPDAVSSPPSVLVAGHAAGPSSGTRVSVRGDSVPSSPALERDQRVPVPLVVGTTPTTAWWLHLMSMLAALGGVLWLITPREDNHVEDSAAFATALRAWAPVLFEEHPTPRSAKKFLNKMRFLSMAQRAPAVRRSPAEAAIARLSALPWLYRVLAAFEPREQTKETLLPGSIPEATLVSLNVIRERYPQWLMDPKFWSTDLRKYVEQHLRPVPDDIRQALEELPQIGAQLNLAHCKEPWSRLEVWVREG